MQPLKIGFDAKRLFLNETGLGNYSRNLLAALSVHYPENEYSLFSPRIDQKYQNFIKKHPVYTPKGIWKFLPHQLWRSYGISNFANVLELDIYHGLSHELPYGIEKSNCKSVVSIHDLIFKTFPELYKTADRFFYDSKIKNAVKSANKIVCISQQTATDLSTFYEVDEQKIQVVYQSCSANYENFTSDEKLKNSLMANYNLPENFVLSVGMNPRKNLEILIDAIVLLKNRNLDFPALLLVGNSNTYQKKLREKVVSNGLDKKVIFLENIGDNELPQLYHMALFSTYLSVYEGFGIPLAESLYCKTPVITNEKGCFSEAAGPGGMYVNVLSKEEIASAIIELSENSSKRNQLSEKGFEYVKRFNADVITAQWIDLYRNLL
ncbi:MAG: glycosyltransferase family 1 protein [Chitinophagaceae bacterium]|nr:MAG: glycosyltransferase family 1 protein [Chitinophagaceae bacterium]